jgi:hypothetical protein
MIGKVFQLIRLPLLLILILTIIRFIVGARGAEYSPRANAATSVLMLTVWCSIIFGALSAKVNGVGWVGTILVGVFLGFYMESLVLIATVISYMAHLNTFFNNCDNLNVIPCEAVPMSKAIVTRLGGLIGGPITGTVMALVGRLLSKLIPL